jgi:hypothetical protein
MLLLVTRQFTTRASEYVAAFSASRQGGEKKRRSGEVMRAAVVLRSRSLLVRRATLLESPYACRQGQRGGAGGRREDQSTRQ